MQSCRQFLLVLCVGLLACTPGVDERISVAQSIAEQSGFESQIVAAGSWSFPVWYRFKDSRLPWYVYIEGDGKAWKSRYKVSENPTPVNPLALKLAVNDKLHNIIYLPRPCQFQIKLNEACEPTIWTSHRFSKPVILAYQELLNSFKKRWDIQDITLVGYSGGGVIASYLSGSRRDVKELVTIASNLDHQSWVSFHRVTPLYGSVSLYEKSLDFSGLAQFHMWGEKDRIVPFEINATLYNTILKNKQSHLKIYPDFTHQCCWAEAWSEINQNIQQTFTNR